MSNKIKPIGLKALAERLWPAYMRGIFGAPPPPLDSAKKPEPPTIPKPQTAAEARDMIVILPSNPAGFDPYTLMYFELPSRQSIGALIIDKASLILHERRIFRENRGMVSRNDPEALPILSYFSMIRFMQLFADNIKGAIEAGAPPDHKTMEFSRAKAEMIEEARLAFVPGEVCMIVCHFSGGKVYFRRVTFRADQFLKSL